MPIARKPSCITFTTDFGLTDHYAGTMKGVVATICPGAPMIDITHNVPAYQVMDGAFAIEQAWRFFPVGTVHVVVIDPGVGSSRRPILLEAGGHRFVAPDNGVLSRVLAQVEEPVVRLIQESRYFLNQQSQTFHGRDIFAPVAAHLASGVAPEKIGPVIENYLRLTIERPVRTARRGWTGAVARIDSFGNVITNFPASDFPLVATELFEFSVGLQQVTTYARSYAETERGELFAIAGSSGFLEIACNQQSAAALLGVGQGAPVELRLLGPRGA